MLRSKRRWEMLTVAGHRLKGLKRVICAKGTAGIKSSDSRVVTLNQWLHSDRAAAASGGELAVKPDDLAAIVYTSGTTGRPKDVMLSHAYVIANVKAIRERLPVGEDVRRTT